MTDILVVDDDKSFLKCMGLGVQSLSPALSVFSAANGLEAIELLKKNSICLLVTDLKMPQMDGFQLLAYVMEHYPDISVIITTGHTIPDIERETLTEAGIFVLFKPFAIHELQQTVSRLLDKQTDGGTLVNVSPGTFMQLINMEQKTCTLRMLEKKSGQMGVLFFREGELLDARMGDHQGEPAALEIFSWESISLSIQNDCPLQERKINRVMNALIMEATRLKDERAAIRLSASAHRTSNVSESSSEGQEHNRNGITHQQLAAMTNRLQNNPELSGFIQNISNDQRWSGVLSQLMEVGSTLNTGKLRAFSIITGGVSNYVIIPSNPPTVLTVHCKCPKETLYRALE